VQQILPSSQLIVQQIYCFYHRAASYS
jgi:hypothetical protein